MTRFTVAALALTLLALDTTRAEASSYGLALHSNATSAAMGVPYGRGLVVAGIVPGGPADVAGIHPADAIGTIGGWPAVDAEMVALRLNQAPYFQPLVMTVACPHTGMVRNALLVGMAGPPQQVVYADVSTSRPSAGRQAASREARPREHHAATPPATGDVIRDAMAWNNSVVANAARIADEAIRSVDRDKRCTGYATSDPRHATCLQTAYASEDVNVQLGQAWLGRARRLNDTINLGIDLVRRCQAGDRGACAESDRHTAKLWEQVRRDERTAAVFSGLAASGRIGNSIARMDAARSEADYTRRAAAFADGYAQWAADAARSGRADLASTYAEQAKQWSDAAGRR